MANLKEQSKKTETLTGGHRLCAGCGHGIVVRQIMNAVEDHAVVGVATGCLEVATTIFPYTAWKCSFIHNAFENVAATVSGSEAAYKALKRRGKIKDNVKFLAFGGDGGTYDIGFQSLSGAMERGHDMVYVCLDNGAYMNTGIQRSSATPRGADTTTSPAGKVIPGKKESRKDLTAIMADHNIAYVAQASPHNWKDMYNKAKKAVEIEGAAFINVLSPCPRGWRYNTPEINDILKSAVETKYWPLFEVEHGEWKLNYKPKKEVRVEDWMKMQGRFSHLFKDENRHILEEVQEEIDKRWDNLLKRCGEN